MSEPIKVGDLVRIAFPSSCCGWIGDVGDYFVVSELKNSLWTCRSCKTIRIGVRALGHPDGGGANPIVLKRIPPLSELDATETKEELHA